VRLERQRQTPLEAADIERNLFRFRAAAATDARESRTEGAAPGPAPGPEVAAGPAGPPPLQAIPLRYIGLLEAPSLAGRVAVLSDGQGNVFYGREGDIIEGRYLVIQIGPVSAELSHLDGRGRQTIRLSGQ
jgi:hypothetical protein